MNKGGILLCGQSSRASPLYRDSHSPIYAGATIISFPGLPLVSGSVSSKKANCLAYATAPASRPRHVSDTANMAYRTSHTCIEMTAAQNQQE